MSAGTVAAGPWSRGSEWRKWDLHVHSPASEGFKGDYNQFVIQLGNADSDVVGINDYFSVAGYKEILRSLSEPASAIEGNKAYREVLEKLRQKTLLPVVECRMTNVLIGKNNKTGTRINFHLIFDPAVSLDDVETLIKGFDVKGQSIGSRYNDKNFLREECSADFNVVPKKLNDDRRGHQDGSERAFPTLSKPSARPFVAFGLPSQVLFRDGCLAFTDFRRRSRTGRPPGWAPRFINDSVDDQIRTVVRHDVRKGTSCPGNGMTRAECLVSWTARVIAGTVQQLRG